MIKINNLLVRILGFSIFILGSFTLKSENIKSIKSDSCFIEVKIDTFIKVENKLFYPYYISNRRTMVYELLGWFSISQEKILYLSDIYKNKNLLYKKASKPQILAKFKKNHFKNQIYYFGRFEHCSIKMTSSEKSFIFKIKSITNLPSDADILDQIIVSKNFNEISFKVFFMGSEKGLQICSSHIRL